MSVKQREFRVLLVDEDEISQTGFLNFIKTKKLAYECTIVSTYTEAGQLIGKQKFDVVVTDYLIGDGTAFDLYEMIGDIPMIITSSIGDEELAVQALKGGAYDYLRKDEDGNYLAFLPEMMEQAVRLKKSKEEFRMLSVALKNINDSVFISDLDHRIIFANQTFCEVFGFEEDEIIDNDSRSLWKNLEEFEKILDETVEGDWAGETLHKKKLGGNFPASLTRSVIRDETNIEEAIVYVIRDITLDKEFEMELITAREAALVASEEKTRFLTRMSHEIRTPMNSILGMAEILGESNLDSEQEKSVKTILGAGETLLGIINDILDLSKIEAGQIDLEQADFELKPLIENVIDMNQHRVRNKGVRLLYDTSKQVHPYFKGDPTRLRQILINLVGNAIKFTSEGFVRLDISVQKEERDYQVLQFSVSDTGIGIAKDKLESIFESFTQADVSTTRKFGGTGLGLNISRQLVFLFGGKIWVESEEGSGSQFHFTISMKKIAFVKKKKASVIDDRALRILMIDDSNDNIALIRAYFANLPYRVDSANNGKSGFKKFKENQYDIVLMDLQMPIMDGYTATEKVREWENLVGSVRTPIIALTGDALKEELEKAIDAGCDHYLTKPVKKSVLLECISEFTRGSKVKSKKWGGQVDVKVSSDLEDLIPGFLENRKKDFVSLNEAINSEDIEILERIGHTLKGACGGYGFHALGEIGDKIELAAKSGNLAEIKNLINDYKENLDNTNVIFVE